MHPASHFRFCPACGAPRQPEEASPLICSACGFTYYLNITCGCAAIVVRPDGKVLFIRRAHEPAKGRLAMPGGFVDEGESAESGLRREVREEVGLVLRDIAFLCSHPNQYFYKGITYAVLDFFFTASASATARAEALDGVAECCWLHPREVDPASLAFPSMTYALEQFLALPDPPPR